MRAQTSWLSRASDTAGLLCSGKKKKKKKNNQYSSLSEVSPTPGTSGWGAAGWVSGEFRRKGASFVVPMG